MSKTEKIQIIEKYVKTRNKYIKKSREDEEAKFENRIVFKCKNQKNFFN